ncbi:ADP-heptose--LPS heptosyltransferase [Flavobacterium faecale]|uniref:ADP-heptose--LPS heptosyltransferase n=1 Tax=Flavobacterium faecale TaxID=1355330 RepID=A0A2S1LBI7_9FLAO|nr:glycosyltransferase family 9 protein [Flavobacterium faecale]AWG21092.1 ADP-heptose--LPS heptosyltransferase [Flavobacterium faecale]
MSFKIKINEFRRKITHGLTRYVGTSKGNKDFDSNSKVVFKNVLINRPNHRLGNLLLITPLVQEINEAFPDCKVDLFVRGGLAPIIFENYKSVDNYIILPRKPFNELVKYAKVWFKLKDKKYDLVLNIDNNSSSGRLSTQFANADFKFFGEEDETVKSQYPDYEHFAKFPVYEFRNYIQKLGHPAKKTAVPTLNMKLTEAELAAAKTILDTIAPNNKKTICVFTFATGSKCYPPSWWNPLYEKLQASFPDYNIIEVLPVENVSQIDFKAPTFYSKDVREIAAFIANTALFIGADSGIMHLASTAQIPVLGLFSVTNPVKYAPYGNASLAVDTNSNSAEQIIDIAKSQLAAHWKA